MSQTPFGVWNVLIARKPAGNNIAPMRQTPFGVWNATGRGANRARRLRSNEADAFRRLELQAKLRLLRAVRGSNEADAFRRLEWKRSE